MLLRKNILTTLHMGPLQVSVRYDGHPHTCNKCGEQCHSTITCHHIQCFSCGEIGHHHVQCDRPNICLYCGSAAHTSNTFPEPFLSFSRQAHSTCPKVSPTPIPHPCTSPRVLLLNHLVRILLQTPQTSMYHHQGDLPATNHPGQGFRPSRGLLLQELLKGTFGTPTREQHRPPPLRLKLMAPLQEQILVTLDTPSTPPPQDVWGAAGEEAQENPEYVVDELPQSSPLPRWSTSVPLLT